MPHDWNSVKSLTPVSVDEAWDSYQKNLPNFKGIVRIEKDPNNNELKIYKDTPSIDLRPEVKQIVDELGAEKLCEARGIKWESRYKDRVVPYWTSDERVDRHGDILRQYWDLSSYRRNPLLLYGHQWDALPMGASIYEEVRMREGDPEYTGPALWQLLLFADQFEWADMLFRLVSAGFLKTGSVGMFPGVILDVRDPAEREALGLGPWGYILGSEEFPNELIEYSCASVPANIGSEQDKLLQMKSSGVLQGRDAQMLRELRRQAIRRGSHDTKLFLEGDAEIVTTWKNLFPNIVLPEHKELDAPILLRELATQSVVVPANLSPEATKKLDDVAADMTRIVHELTDKMDRLETKMEDFAHDASNRTTLPKEEPSVLGLGLVAALNKSNQILVESGSAA